MPDFAQARLSMVQCQLNPSGVITEAVLRAFNETPRELFLPRDRQSMAYSDDHIDLGSGRVLPRPALLAQMIEAVRPRKTDRALCIGGATGYAAVIMAQLSAQVIDLECDDKFGPLNHDAVQELGFGNIIRQIGDVTRGVPNQTFDVIVAEGAYAELPQSLCANLANGGRMVCLVVPNGRAVGTVLLTERDGAGYLTTRPLFDAWAPYLPGCTPVARFALA